MDEDDRLDDIPHVIDPHISQMFPRDDTESPYNGSKGNGKKSAQTSTVPSAPSASSTSTTNAGISLYN